MSKYPTTITEEVLANIAQVSDNEVSKDIADTQAEIVNLEKEIEGHRLIAEAQAGTAAGKMAAFRRDGKTDGLTLRRDFVRFLQAVQDARNEANHVI